MLLPALQTFYSLLLRHLNATEDDILEAKELAASLSLESVRAVLYPDCLGARTLSTNMSTIDDG